MIGIVAGEGCTVFEFKPMFASKTRFDFSFKLPNFTQDDLLKEYGFAFSRGTIWLMSGDETRYVDNKIITLLKKIFNS